MYRNFALGACLFFVLFVLEGCGGSSKKDGAQTPPDTTAVADTTPKPEPEKVVGDAYWRDLSRYLAGMPPLADDMLDSLPNRKEAVDHREKMTQSWEAKDDRHYQKLRNFAKAEFPTENATTETVFYPFGGPDFVSVHQFFPNASHYVMCGLEDEGQPFDLKNIPPDALAANLENVRNTLKTILGASFFITRDMTQDLRRREIKGILPIMLLFIARTGNEVLTAKRVRVEPDGSLYYLTPADSNIKQTHRDTVVTGIEIKFRRANDPNAPVQTVHYFAFDASNPAYAKTPQIDKYFEKLTNTCTFFKSASYLVHGEGFSKFRDRIAGASKFVIQDETGFQYKYYDQSKWNLRLYGKYGQPINDFSWAYQSDLMKAYQTDSTVKNVDFQIGYGRICTVIIARRKEGGETVK